jgi:hypothetical protein
MLIYQHTESGAQDKNMVLVQSAFLMSNLQVFVDPASLGTPSRPSVLAVLTEQQRESALQKKLLQSKLTVLEEKDTIPGEVREAISINRHSDTSECASALRSLIDALNLAPSDARQFAIDEAVQKGSAWLQAYDADAATGRRNIDESGNGDGGSSAESSARLIFSASLPEITTYGALFSAVDIGSAAFSALIKLDSLDLKQKKNIISDMQRVWGQEGADKKRDALKKIYAMYTYAHLASMDPGQAIVNRNELYSMACGLFDSKARRASAISPEITVPDDMREAKKCSWFAVALLVHQERKGATRSP